MKYFKLHFFKKSNFTLEMLFEGIDLARNLTFRSWRIRGSCRCSLQLKTDWVFVLSPSRQSPKWQPPNNHVYIRDQFSPISEGELYQWKAHMRFPESCLGSHIHNLGRWRINQKKFMDRLFQIFENMAELGSWFLNRDTTAVKQLTISSPRCRAHRDRWRADWKKRF